MPVMACVHLAVCLSLACSGCRQASQPAYSEDQVRTVIVPGTSRRDVERTFGQPLTTMPTGDGETVAIYRLPDTRSAAFRDQFTGFQVRYRENLVTRWFPVYSDQSTSGTPQDTRAQTQIGQFPGYQPDGISLYSVIDPCII